MPLRSHVCSGILQLSKKLSENEKAPIKQLISASFSM